MGFSNIKNLKEKINSTKNLVKSCKLFGHDGDFVDGNRSRVCITKRVILVGMKPTKWNSITNDVANNITYIIRR